MLSFSEMLKGKQHKLDKNKNGKLDQHDFKLLRKEEQELEEASKSGEGKVETKKYSWGTMKTVHHGSEFSVPLHPEHHQAIAKLKDNQEHKFKDETGHHWTAKRMGDKVHIHGANNGGKTVVNHSDLKEEVEDIDEGMKQNLRKYVPGYAKRELNKKMDAEKFGRTDVDKDANYYRYKKIADKLKKEETELDEAKKPMSKDEKDKVVGAVQAAMRKSYGNVVAGRAQLAAARLAAKIKAGKKTNEEVEESSCSCSECSCSSQVEEGIVDVVKNVISKERAYQAQKQKKAGEVLSKLKKEEVETTDQLEERNKQNAVKRKMMDASRGARFKAQGNYVPDAEPQHKTAQAHNKAIGRAIRKMSNEEVELDEKLNVAASSMGTVIKDFKKSDAPQFAGKSVEKRRQMAIAAKLQADRMKKEGVEMKSYRQFMEELVSKLPEETELDEAEQATGGLKDACWKGYTAVGMKMKNGKKVPNCVPVKEDVVDEEVEQIDELDIKLLKSMQKHAKENPRPKSSSDDAIDRSTGRLKPYGYRGKSEYEKSETGDDDEPQKRGRKTGVSVGSYKRRQPK